MVNRVHHGEVVSHSAVVLLLEHACARTMPNSAIGGHISLAVALVLGGSLRRWLEHSIANVRVLCCGIHFM